MERTEALSKCSASSIRAGHERSWFVIVGAGLESDVKEVKEFIKESGLDGRVVLTGRLSDIPEAMAGMDVLVMPSLWEGFPRALIEAMASGKPSIASSVGEVSQIIEDGKTGFIIPKDDKTALINAMERCIGMGDDLAKVGAAARNTVAGFTIAKHLEAVQNEYDKIIG